MKVPLGDSFCTVNSVAHLNGVQIDLHYAFFPPNQFDKYGKIGLQTLSQPAGRGPEEDVFGRLLADCASPAPALAFLHFLYGIIDFGEVESVVVEEALVFTGHDCNGEVDRHGVEWHPVVAELNLLSAAHLLGAPDEHEWCQIDRTPAIDDNRKDCTPEKEEYNPLQYLLYLQ